jgi:hypothetical protein
VEFPQLEIWKSAELSAALAAILAKLNIDIPKAQFSSEF